MVGVIDRVLDLEGDKVGVMDRVLDLEGVMDGVMDRVLVGDTVGVLLREPVALRLGVNVGVLL